jgi:hypothetical protein
LKIDDEKKKIENEFKQKEEMASPTKLKGDRKVIGESEKKPKPFSPRKGLDKKKK